MKKRIGIMGGTFDPPHAGHMAMAERVRTVMALDEIWFLPTGGITYKDNRNLSSPKDRLAMTRLAVEGNPYFSVNEMESVKEEPSYSYDTMEKLKALYPDTDFVFLVGADSLAYMEAWREPERLLRCCTIAAVNRPGVDIEQMKEKKKMLEDTFGGEIVLVSMPDMDISSTQLREQLQKGTYRGNELKESVLAYIHEHRLYRG